MVRKKEVESSETPFLFGKYQLCRVIGTGRSGTVYLAIHRELEEYRAIKRVSKAAVDYQQFRREALILKNLRHPGIPIVYDLEEDESYSYLIEEYLEGTTLSALIQQQGNLSKAMTVQYGIQICHLVYCLHSAKPTPILYLDLQPKNLLLCHETVKLVDFNHAVSVEEANLSRKRYGTVGCAAPEQYTKEPMDERTDLYAIGAILYFLLTGSYPGKEPSFQEKTWGKKLTEILRTCLQPEKERRYESVLALCKELERMEGSGTGVFKEKPCSSLTIALAGAKAGIGTTHLAIGLSEYLLHQGYSIIYEEKNESGAVLALARHFEKKRDVCGIFCIRNLRMRPAYGANVVLETPLCDIRVLDYGSHWERISMDRPDIALLVHSGKWWTREPEKGAEDLVGKDGMLHIYNQCLEQSFSGKENEFFCPVFPNPFSLTREAKEFYRRVCSSEIVKSRLPEGGIVRRIFGNAEKWRKAMALKRQKPWE